LCDWRTSQEKKILSPALSQILSQNLLSLALSIHVDSVKNDAFKVVLFLILILK
jgi:hypothetical protein